MTNDDESDLDHERAAPLPGRVLLDLVYDELRRLAASKIQRELPGQTLTPTGLVHEAWLRIAGANNNQQWNSRSHFMAAAAEAMRRILVEQARRKLRIKHGGRFTRVQSDTNEFPSVIPDERIIAVDLALNEMNTEMPELVELVKMRFFLAMSNEEIAAIQNLSESTVKRRWRLARAWLAKKLTDFQEPGLDSSEPEPAP